MPTARAGKLGGVAVHADLFSTATDPVRYARTPLAAGRGDTTILGLRAVIQRTRPWRVLSGGVRGLGWEKHSGFSSDRSGLDTASAFGLGGFTGTSLWFDPRLDLSVIVLASRRHPNAWRVEGYGWLLTSRAVLDAIRAGTPRAAVDRAAEGVREPRPADTAPALRLSHGTVLRILQPTPSCRPRFRSHGLHEVGRRSRCRSGQWAI